MRRNPKNQIIDEIFTPIMMKLGVPEVERSSGISYHFRIDEDLYKRIYFFFSNSENCLKVQLQPEPHSLKELSPDFDKATVKRANLSEWDCWKYEDDKEFKKALAEIQEMIHKYFAIWLTVPYEDPILKLDLKELHARYNHLLTILDRLLASEADPSINDAMKMLNVTQIRIVKEELAKTNEHIAKRKALDEG